MWWMVTRLLKTTIQFGFCVRSSSRLARVGMDTLGSSVQRSKSAKHQDGMTAWILCEVWVNVMHVQEEE